MRFFKTIGHEKQKKLFQTIYENQALSHGYILSGPEHVGKTTFALELAHLLDADPVMDITFSDKEEGILISDARGLQAHLSLTPVGKVKVAIISYADRMTLEAANALLKILEEPPPKSVLLLTTSNYNRLLPTVRSRLQRIGFGYSSDSEIAMAVKEFGLEDELEAKVLALASGSIGMAKRMSSDNTVLEFFEKARETYNILIDGSQEQKLKSIDTLLSYEPFDVKRLLVFAMSCWTKDGKRADLGEKFLAVWKDLQYNLNMRLILDKLFLI